MEHDPGYEPIIGGHKSHSWEKELRERGLHASANEIAKSGDAFFEGPQGHPAPGSGSPRRDRVSASPARTLRAGETPVIGSFGSPGSRHSVPPSGSPHGVAGGSPLPSTSRPYEATYASGPPQLSTYVGHSAPAASSVYASQAPLSGSPMQAPTYAPPAVNTSSPSYISAGAPARTSSPLYGSAAPPVMHTSPTYASAAPPVHTSIPAYASGAGPYESTRVQTTTTTTTTTYASPPAQSGVYSQPPSYVAPPVVDYKVSQPLPSTGISPPRSGSPHHSGAFNSAFGQAPVHSSPLASGANLHSGRMGSASPQPAATPLHQGADFDPGYEPIIGGHKSHSWEKELRERGLHATANRVAAEGDAFFDGPQGHPAPGSGSPRRDKVSPSPSRRGYSPV